jgi:protein ImuB
VKRSTSPKSAAAKDREAEIQQILGILHKWGIHTLGQLAALDKEQLGARLGPEAVRMWERANGQSDRPLKLVRPSESFEESFEFENEIETADPLLFMLRRFLEQLTLRLSVIYLVAKELTLRITFANPPAVRRDGFAAANTQIYQRVFKIPQPTNDVDLLFRMLHTHLENFRSECPISAVSLDAQPTKPPKQQFGLFETTLRNPNQLSETLARLTALLGADRVGTPVLEETHRPDAFRMEPFAWSFDDNPSSSPSPPNREKGSPLPEGEDGGEGHRCLRTTSKLRVALRRFRPAASATVFISENVPAHFQSKKISGKPVDQRGPYLASGNWWDEKIWSRSEWDLQLENGVLLRCHQSPPSLKLPPTLASARRAGVAGVEKWEVDGIYD